MRPVAILPALLIAAAASAQTYTNNFNTSDPAVVLESSDQQYDLSSPPYATKPWDTSSTDGTYSISGQASVTDAYVAQYPVAANAGGAGFTLWLTLPGLTSFTLADIGSLAYEFDIGELHTGGNLSIGLAPTVGSSPANNLMFYNGYNAIVGTTITGSRYSVVVSDFAPVSEATYTAIVISGLGAFGPLAGGGFGALRNQYLDYTLDSVSLTLAAPVPEPSTYGLILGGLALAGVAVRRRAKRA